METKRTSPILKDLLPRAASSAFVLCLGLLAIGAPALRAEWVVGPAILETVITEPANLTFPAVVGLDDTVSVHWPHFFEIDCNTDPEEVATDMVTATWGGATGTLSELGYKFTLDTSTSGVKTFQVTLSDNGEYMHADDTDVVLTFQVTVVKVTAIAYTGSKTIGDALVKTDFAITTHPTGYRDHVVVSLSTGTIATGNNWFTASAGTSSESCNVTAVEFESEMISYGALDGDTYGSSDVIETATIQYRAIGLDSINAGTTVARVDYTVAGAFGATHGDLSGYSFTETHNADIATYDIFSGGGGTASTSKRPAAVSLCGLVGTSSTGPGNPRPAAEFITAATLAKIAWVTVGFGIGIATEKYKAANEKAESKAAATPAGEQTHSLKKKPGGEGWSDPEVNATAKTTPGGVGWYKVQSGAHVSTVKPKIEMDTSAPAPATLTHDDHDDWALTPQIMCRIGYPALNGLPAHPLYAVKNYRSGVKIDLDHALAAAKKWAFNSVGTYSFLKMLEESTTYDVGPNPKPCVVVW